jgi:hypothetical protein
MRLSLAVLAGLALVGVASLGGATAPDEPAKDEELRRLLKERYEAAWGEMEARTALYNAGRVSLTDTCDAIRRFSTAGVEAAKTSAYRVKVCERAFEGAKAIEESVKGKYGNGVEPIHAMKLATYVRLDMEIKLHEARKAADAENARHKLDDSDLPPITPQDRSPRAET